MPLIVVLMPSFVARRLQSLSFSHLKSADAPSEVRNCPECSPWGYARTPNEIRKWSAAEPHRPFPSTRSAHRRTTSSWKARAGAG